MSNQDLTTSLGLNSQPARTELKRWEKDVNRSTWKIARDFERAERAKERAARDVERNRRAAYEKTQRVHQVAAVAIVAGIGAINGALQEAAKTDANVANGLKQVSEEYNGLKADLGRDLGNGGLLAFLAKSLEVVRAVRNVAVDAVGAMMGGDTRRQRRVQNAADARDAALRGRQNAAGLLDEINGVDTSERDETRRVNQRANELGLSAEDRSKAREALAARRERDRAAAEAAARAQETQRRQQQRVADLRRQAERERIAGERTGDGSRAENAVMLEREAALLEKRLRLTKEQVSTEEQAIEMAKERELQNERAAIALRKLEAAEDERVKRQQRERAESESRHRFRQADMRVQLLRARGQNGQADALSAELDHLERVAQLEKERLLTEEQRAQAIALSLQLRDAEMAALQRQSARDFGIGLTGGATLLRQIGGPDGVPGGSPAVELARQSRDLLQEIAENTAGGGVARAA